MRQGKFSVLIATGMQSYWASFAVKNRIFSVTGNGALSRDFSRERKSDKGSENLTLGSLLL